jgi:hypothetical protein
MPSISTQTDHCCDVIGRLNDEFLEASDEITTLKNKLRAAEEDAVREYWGQNPTVQDEISHPYDPEGSIPDGWLCGDLYNEFKRLQHEEDGVAWNHPTKAQGWTKIQKHHRKYRMDHGEKWPAGKLLVKDGRRIFKQEDGTYLDISGQLLVAS